VKNGNVQDTANKEAAAVDLTSIGGELNSSLSLLVGNIPVMNWSIRTNIR
jgi:hypothetical protein